MSQRRRHFPLLATLIVRPYVHGAAFVVRTAAMQGAVRHLADLDTQPENERELIIPTGPGWGANLNEEVAKKHRVETGSALRFEGLDNIPVH